MQKKSISKLILIIWIAFASLYVVYGEYNRLKNVVALRSYKAGLGDAVNKLIEEAGKCQPFPVSSSEKKVTLISVDCLTPQDSQNQTVTE